MRSIRLAAAVTVLLATAALAEAPKPAAITVENVPPISDDLAAATRPYLEYRTAAFDGWNSATRSMLIATRFGSTSQLHLVATAGGMRRQVSFEEEPVGGHPSPAGDVIVAVKDVGGGEFFQLYTLKDGRLTLLTDGKSRNDFGAWDKEGRLIGYSSTRRDGTDTDLYVMDPRDRSSDRLIAQVHGGGWNFADFAPGGRQAVVVNSQSITNSDPYLLDVASGRLTAIGNVKKDINYGTVRFAPDGSLWATSDENSDVLRLGRLDPRSGRFAPVSPASHWDVEDFDIGKDGRTIAFTVNEAGSSRLFLLDVASGQVRPVSALPAGVISGLEFAPWGPLGFSLDSARSPSDVFSLDPATLAVTRWTASETGGLDPTANAEPQLIEIKSFDGEPVSGLLYRPDPRRFPGPRPLIVSIHGGPEGQSRPGFLGRNNYLINELGIAIFYPNVRGSTGYGKRFVGLDNGPWQRENSVKDIGPFLDRLAADPAIDPKRIAVTGGSYGGYMCYASSIFYARRLKGSVCIVAVSGFVSLLEHTESYRRDLRRVEYGDERDPRQRAKLLEISPLRRASEIRDPLFVVAGFNDPRVPKSEADQMVKAVRATGNPAWYMVAANEGHGYKKKENLDYQFWSTVQFWKTNLLGPEPAR
ncbi:prolyl oligopeptidase family serine peptidase [Sphingomonas sp.]|uniref:S9 family peptidase n=1 Tax=Sphingomonas sp. TaxID=28214 RepID=UPI00389E60AE